MLTADIGHVYCLPRQWMTTITQELDPAISNERVALIAVERCRIVRSLCIESTPAASVVVRNIVPAPDQEARREGRFLHVTVEVPAWNSNMVTVFTTRTLEPVSYLLRSLTNNAQLRHSCP